MNILESIMAERRADVAGARKRVSRDALRDEAGARVHHSLAASLESGAGTRIVSEMKKASPSAGLLRHQYEPAEIAARYEAQGAAGISVLTEPRHFLGSAEHLRQARAACNLPILRKDFTCDAYQLYEAAAWGADIVLLIIAALDPAELRDLYDEAVGIGLEVLAEAHTADEVEAALALERSIVGVNSRNLKTLKTDLAVARDLSGYIPGNRLSIAESGIKKRGDIVSLEACGYSGFLIGEALVKQDDPGGKLAELLGSGS